MATTRGNAQASGKYRSKFEKEIAKELKEKEIEFTYEEDIIPYVLPAKDKSYNPDFKIYTGTKFIYIEAKGIFDREDRAKHLLIREQHPHLDIRIVFQNANGKIYKKSKTTYAQWCEKNDIQWAHRKIPEAWYSEF